MPEPIQNPAGQGGAAGGEGMPPAGTPPQPSIYKDLQAKKGFKSEEDLAKSYVEAEQSLGKHQNITNKVKQQLESQGYTIDDEGNVKPMGQPAGQPPNYPPQGGYPPQGQPQETIYDPYTGTPITDPIALQLARMPVGHREMFIVNAMLEQREKQQRDAYQADTDVLSRPEAKGFEEDVRKVMQALPLQERAKKQSWEDALWRVIGMRYHQDKKNFAQQGVEQFINKDNLQRPDGSGAGGGGAGLSPDQEQQYQWYAKNQPGLFKDRADFQRASSPTGR
jgi:hypothetical protein